MRTLVWFLLALLVTAAVAYAVFRIAGPERLWRGIAGPPDLGAVDFSTLERPASPNTFLVCPEGACPGTRADAASPVYAASAAATLAAAVSAIEAMPRTVRVDAGADPLKARFVARTSLMRFPDTVSIEVLPLPAADGADQDATRARSAIAIYSRSQLGRSDLGENRRRVGAILEALAARLPLENGGGAR